MKNLIICLLCVLVACVPVPEPIKEPTREPTKVVEKETVPEKEFDVTLPTRTVKQFSSHGTVTYGLTEDNTIVRIDKPNATWEYKYDRGKLVEITGPKDIEFFYDRGKLSAIDLGATKLQFEYDARGRLITITGESIPWHIWHDSVDYVRGVKRGVAGETSIDYDKQGKVKYLTRGRRTTNVFFDDRGRVRNFDADDVKFILGYWRDDQLISLSGKTFGPGLGVSYGPDYPPFEATIAHSEDDSKFTSAYTDTLYKVVDHYVYCNYVRRLKELLFDGISYTFYTSYFKGDLPSYFVMRFMCVPYET